MSAVKGVNKTIQDTVTPGTLLETEVAYAKEHVIYEEYECAALASGSTIALPELPLNAMITDWVIDHDALGSSVTLAFGHATTAGALLAALACATADKKNMTDDGVAAALGLRLDTATKQALLITTGGATATGTIKVMVKYTTKN